MKVYLIRAAEWESDVNCVCLTKEIAIRERRRLANEYSLTNDEMDEFIECVEFDVIEE